MIGNDYLFPNSIIDQKEVALRPNNHIQILQTDLQTFP